MKQPYVVMIFVLIPAKEYIFYELFLTAQFMMHQLGNKL